MIWKIMALMHLLAPALASIVFAYTLIDLFIHCMWRLFFERNDYEEEEYIETDRPYKGGTSVVDTFSDTFKLPTPQFED